MAGTLNDVKVFKRHFDYLVHQKGKISDLRSQPEQWAIEYRASLQRDFDTLRKVLQPMSRAILDIGSGLGGIDIMLWRHYAWGRGGTNIWLLDGKDDKPPEIGEIDHDQTFSSHAMAEDFFKHNGAKLTGYIDAADTEASMPLPIFNLVISLGSWCFHYEPNRYINLVAAHTSPSSLVVTDMRSSKPEWIKQMEVHFKAVAVLHESTKFKRMVWRPWGVLGA